MWVSVPKGKHAMNFIDVLFILIFFWILGAGFFYGMLRLVVLIVSLYLALILASLFYQSVGLFFMRNFHADSFVARYVAFFLVLQISFIFLSIAGIYTFREWKLPGGLQYLDHIVGTLLGMLLGAFVVGIGGSLLWNLMIVHGGQNIDLPIFRSVGSLVYTSTILRYFATSILHLTYSYLSQRLL